MKTTKIKTVENVSDKDIRVGIQKVDERVIKEIRQSEINAPLSTEEKIFIKKGK